MGGRVRGGRRARRDNQPHVWNREALSALSFSLHLSSCLPLLSILLKVLSGISNRAARFALSLQKDRVVVASQFVTDPLKKGPRPLVLLIDQKAERIGAL